MLRRRFSVILAVLSVAAVFLAASPASAQRHGGGSRGGGGWHGGGGGWHGGGGGWHGGNGWHGGGWHNGGWGNGWGAFGLGYGLGYLSSGYGWGGYYPGYGGGYYGGYYPAYSWGGYYPGYTDWGYSTTSYPDYYVGSPSGFVTDTYASAPVMTTQSSLYPPSSSVAENAARVRVRVPANATVWFEGDQTRQTGPERDFVSPPLSPGQTYTYDIRARWTDNGQPVEQTRTIRVRAGETSTVDFTSPAG